MPQRMANPQTNYVPATAPLGMEGGLASGDGWGGASRTGEHWGKTPRPDFARGPSPGFATLSPSHGRGTCGAAELAGRMPASWRADCSDMGSGATAGDSGAISVTVPTRDSTQRHIVRHLLPAQGLGVPCAPGINDRRVTHNMCCVLSRKHSCMTTEVLAHGHHFVGASGLVARTPQRGVPTFPTPRRWSGAE